MLIEPTLTGLRGFLIDTPLLGQVRGIRDGAVMIEDGRIAAAGPFEEVAGSFRGAQVRWRHSPESVILPGLVDLRVHAALGACLGRVRRDFAVWNGEVGVPAVRAFRAAAARVEGRVVFDELLRHGTTCAVVEAGAAADSADLVFAAAEASGLRAVVGMAVADGTRGDAWPVAKSASAALDTTRQLAAKWHQRDGGRIECGVFLRGPGWCSNDLVVGARALAGESGMLFHSEIGVLGHDARVFADLPRAVATVLGRPCEDVRSSLLHAGVVLCPSHDRFHRMVPASPADFEGNPVGFGTGWGRGPDVSMWRVMRSAVEASPNLTAASAFFHATLGAAGVLRRADEMGSLDVGKQADLIVIDVATLTRKRAANPHAAFSAADVLALLVFRGGVGEVVESIVGGRTVYAAPPPLLV